MESINQFMSVISLIIAIPMIIIGVICVVRESAVYGFFLMILGCCNLYTGLPVLSDKLNNNQYVTRMVAENAPVCIPLSKIKDTYIDDSFLYVYYKTCSTGEVKQINEKEYIELNVPINELINEPTAIQKIIEKKRIDIINDLLITLFIFLIVSVGGLWGLLKMIRRL